MSKKLTNREEFDLYLEGFESNPLFWGRIYFKHHFRNHSPKFHVDLLIDSVNERYLAVAAPRESAKSTVLTFLHSIHGICFKKYRFIVIVQNTFSKAAGSLETIKKEFRENKRLKDTFPVTITRDAMGDSIFRHPDGFETRVLCKGNEQVGSVRGEKFGAYRPDLIIGDDIEDDELVRSPERRQQLKDEFNEALVPAGDREYCKYIFIGTILHDDSLMSELVSKDKYPEYKKLFFKALNEDKDNEWSLWEEKWTVEELQRMRGNKPSVFAKEYQNDPVSGLMAKFHKEDFRYWRIENLDYILFDKQARITSRGSLSTCKAAIACDLAWETKRESDYSVILSAFLTPQSDILVDHYTFKKGLRPHEIEEILFSLEARLRSITGTRVPIGFEKAKLEKVIRFLLREAMKRRNKWLLFKDLQWDADKVQRIVTRLEPRYAQHSLYHKQGMGELEHQLLRIPSGTHDDLPDALQGVVQLLQYPRGKVKPKAEDTEFEWWRKKAIEARLKPRKRYVFGNKANRRVKIPCKVAYR